MQNLDQWAWTRRTLLKTSLVGLLTLTGRVFDPWAACAQDLPDGALTIYNVHTNEWLRAKYRDAAGNYDLAALDELNHILRCHHTGEVAAMDVRVIEHAWLARVCMSKDRRSICIFPAFIQGRFGKRR
jgi:uncharacterized protein YcbK (DUF882 family)